MLTEVVSRVGCRYASVGGVDKFGGGLYACGRRRGQISAILSRIRHVDADHCGSLIMRVLFDQQQILPNRDIKTLL